MELLRPGVFIQERPTAGGAIEGVATSTLGAIGTAKKGPDGEPTLVTSFNEFKKIFGGYMDPDDSQLAHAMAGFFGNGGSRAYVVREVGVGAVEAEVTVTDGAEVEPADAVTFTAASKGAWGNKVSVDVAVDTEFVGKLAAAATAETAVSFVGTPNVAVGDIIRFGTTVTDYVVTDVNGTTVTVDSAVTEAEGEIIYVVGLTLTVYDDGVSVEEYNFVRFAPTHEDGYAMALKDSNYISMALAGATPIVPKEDLVSLSGGADGAAVSDVTLTAFDTVSIQLLIAPGFETVAIADEMISYCESRQDCFAILATGKGLTATEALEYRTVDGNFNTSYAALYYPWIKISNPLGAGLETITPVGHVAGVYARTDRLRNVAKAPAGSAATLYGVIAFESDITNGEQEVLNPKGVNVLRSVPGAGKVVWGARSLSTDPQWRYVTDRRVFIYLSTSILQGTTWAPFEPNDSVLWGRITASVGAFLRTSYGLGLLAQNGGPEAAFYVLCDASTNPQEKIDSGIVTTEIGVALRKPGEFVVFQLGQWSGGGTVETVEGEE